jgi:hypothetical protein
MNAIDILVAQDKPTLVACAKRFYFGTKGKFGHDWARDEAIAGVETYLFSDLRWEGIEATVISDVAHEIADEVINQGSSGSLTFDIAGVL